MGYIVEIVEPDSAYGPSHVNNGMVFVKVRAENGTQAESVLAITHQGGPNDIPDLTMATELTEVNGFYQGNLDAPCRENEPYPSFRIYVQAQFESPDGAMGDPVVVTVHDRYLGKCADVMGSTIMGKGAVGKGQ